MKHHKTLPFRASLRKLHLAEWFQILFLYFRKLRRYFPRVSGLNFWFFIQGTFCFLCASELLLQGTIILGPRFSISAVSVVKLQPAEMFSSVVQTSQLQNLQTLFYRTFQNYMRNMLQFLWPTILPALHLQLRTVWSWRMGTWFLFKQSCWKCVHRVHHCSS